MGGRGVGDLEGSGLKLRKLMVGFENRNMENIGMLDARRACSLKRETNGVGDPDVGDYQERRSIN